MVRDERIRDARWVEKSETVNEFKESKNWLLWSFLFTVTGSWDKVSFYSHELSRYRSCWPQIPQTLKYWDLRTPNPVASVQLPERCYSAQSHFWYFSLQMYWLDIRDPSHSTGCSIPLDGSRYSRTSHPNFQSQPTYSSFQNDHFSFTMAN